MNNENEPYETTPDGEEHATVDWITRIVTCVLLALIITLMAACPAQAAGSWCSDWADGFEVGYCYRKIVCDYVPPQICPSPQDGQTDGFTRGLRDGLAFARREL